MSMQFKLSIHVAVAVIAAAMLSACDDSLQRERPTATKLEVVRADPARNRLWVLDLEVISVYDNTNGRRLRRIVLPEWMVLPKKYSCLPDLALDSSGTAFVSSNVLPVLWRIEPQRYEVTRIELALDTDTDKDVGFTGLSFAGDGTLLAAGAMAAALWQIDTSAASARKIASYPSVASGCDPATLVRAGRDQPRSVIAASEPK
jgi:hypothetical protein